MIERPPGRIGALLVVGCLLVGSLVGAGATTPDPALNDYPDADEFGPDYGDYVGDVVEFGGTVVATDPVVLEVDHGIDGTLLLVVTNVEQPVDPGDRLRVFGTVQPGYAVEAHGTVAVAPWEQYYAWGISFVAGLWVLARFLRGWSFDRESLWFAPREGADA